MAFYDYECRGCGHVQEVQHLMAESPRVRCPKCKKGCDRLIGVPNVGLGKADKEVWNYNDCRTHPPVWLKSKDGKKRVRFDASKHGRRKGGESHLRKGK